MNLRKNIFILFISFLSVNLFAQNEVSFRSLTLEEAIKKAGEENKMIFIDCYTTWCGPCKRLSKETFTDSLFADYINNKFIALKFDCEKEEGINIKTDYNVGAFPTLLYLDSEGNEVFRTTGFDKAEPLITKIESGTSKENGLLALEKKYNAGNREYSFLMKYIEMLSMAYKNDEISKIVEDYLNDKAEELISNDEYFGLFVKYISDPKHVSTSVVFNNRAEFCNKYGEKVVNSKLSNIWYVNGNKISGNRTIAKEEKAALLNEYINWLRSSGIEDVDKMENYFYITFSKLS